MEGQTSVSFRFFQRESQYSAFFYLRVSIILKYNFFVVQWRKLLKPWWARPQVTPALPSPKRLYSNLGYNTGWSWILEFQLTDNWISMIFSGPFAHPVSWSLIVEHKNIMKMEKEKHLEALLSSGAPWYGQFWAWTKSFWESTKAC